MNIFEVFVNCFFFKINTIFMINIKSCQKIKLFIFSIKILKKYFIN